MQPEHEPPEPQPPFDPPGGGLGYALITAANAWRSELAAALAPLALTPAQFFAIAALLHGLGRGTEPPTQRQLAERIGSDVNTTSQVIRALERRGVVRRAPRLGDSRAYAVSLTDAGVRLARLATAEARALNRRYFADADSEALLEELQDLAARSQARRGPSGALQ